MTTTVIRARNVNVALEEALWRLESYDPSVEESRNGPVRAFPGPLVTTLDHPDERVLFWDTRDANPFFHLMEALWMLEGRNDLAFPEFFVKRFRDFSDDGETLQGAYGHRWRNHFGFDQVWETIKLLEEQPTTRRAVIQMWSSYDDLGADSNDIPCNLVAVFDRRGGVLNTYISNRSNDLVWGLYGANAVHFSILQEFIASALRIPMGQMTTFSVNAHMYTGLKKGGEMFDYPDRDDRYTTHGISPYPLVSVEDIREWEEDLNLFMEDPSRTDLTYRDPFFRYVAHPMYMAWDAHKAGEPAEARSWAQMIEAEDWMVACTEWLNRRHFVNL